MFKVSPASLQTFIDTPNCVLEDRVQHSTVHIPNVFCDGHLRIISFLFCNRQAHRDFLITLYYKRSKPPTFTGSTTLVAILREVSYK